MENGENSQMRTKRFAVIGDPVGHSLSPLLHRTVYKAVDFYEKIGVQASYEKQRVTPEALAAFLSDTELDGFNVTIPHKERVYALLPEARGDAALAGAVNTVVREEGRMVGYNTDMGGLLKALQSFGAEYKDAVVCVFGTGGAARGIARKAAAEGAREVRILGRSKEKAEAILPGAFLGMPTAQTLRGADLFLNATPLGMTGMTEDFADLSFLNGLPAQAFVYDLVYTPAETRLLAAARACGLRAENGLSMLVWQGLLSDALFGIAPAQTLLTPEYYGAAYAALRKELTQKK
ncbi:MAG: shikimate dehydrogenase [Clostridiales bacterium]|nr:shikimate dehydrogenase [Clostridiales bacterium]